MHGISTKFGIHTSPSVDILCDNQSLIKFSCDLVQKQWTKHIEFHMHYIRELVHYMTNILHYFTTEEKVANIFTKYFTKNIFFYNRSLLGMKA